MAAVIHRRIIEQSLDVAEAGNRRRGVNLPAGLVNASHASVARSAEIQPELAGTVVRRRRAGGGEVRPGRRVGGVFERTVPRGLLRRVNVFVLEKVR